MGGKRDKQYSHSILSFQNVWQTRRKKKKLQYTQAATCVANIEKYFEIQQYMLNRWILRAFLNEDFDCGVVMSYGTLFQITGPVGYLKRMFDQSI